MKWVFLGRCLNLATLLILIVMLVIVVRNSKVSSDESVLLQQLENYKLEVIETRAKNIELINTKINTLAEQQNAYQITVDKRLTIMENTITKYMELDKNKK